MNLNWKTALAGAALAALCACSSNTKTSQNVTTETPNGNPSTTPSGQQSAAAKMALVRFVEAVPGSGMDLWFGDGQIFTNVAYKDITPYKEVPAERHDFKLQPSGKTEVTAPASASEGLTGGYHYTIVAQRKDGKLNLEVVNDDLTPPSGGKAKVRVINAAIGLGKVDVVDSQGDVVTGVGPDTASSYKDVTPAAGPLEVRRADKHNDIARVPNFTIDPAKLYTIVIVGGGGQPYTVIPVTDQLTTPTPTTGD
jgi:hypothetical protein